MTPSGDQPRAMDALRPELNGSVAFITGAARGFGAAFARAFVEAGGRVAVADIDVEGAERIAEELGREAEDAAMAVQCDVAREDDVEAAAARVARQWGGIDILINNAGLHLTKYNQPFGELPRDEIRSLLDVNVMGVVNCTLACRDSMAERGGGSVINIASISAYSSTTPYGVSKLAVRGLTIALATELASRHIRVNAIAPGLMATENALADLPQSLVDDFREHRQLVTRQGEVADIVATALYLCSPAASFVSGETLKISGGYPLAM